MELLSAFVVKRHILSLCTVILIHMFNKSSNLLVTPFENNYPSELLYTYSFKRLWNKKYGWMMNAETELEFLKVVSQNDL